MILDFNQHSLQELLSSVNSACKKKLSVFRSFLAKTNYSNFTLSSSVNYSNYYSKIEEKGFDSNFGEIDYSKWLLAFGLQKSMNYKKISFYYGLDLFGGLGIKDCDISGGWIQRLDGVYYDLWFGISPVIGIEYNIVSRISVSIETSLDLALVYGNYDFHGVKLNFEPLLNPVNAISINYSF